MNVLVVGRGRVGNGLVAALVASPDIDVDASGRKLSPKVVARADAIVLAVSDSEIESAAERIAPHLSGHAVVVHCAGARGIDALRACAAEGAAVGVMHPLVSFPSKRRHPPVRNATFTVHGDRRAIAVSRRIATACGARTVVASPGDAAYHAAAALTANGAAALAFASVAILERVGFGRRAAERAIGGLLQTVGHNVQTLGVPDALTGPVARGEPTTIRKHRNALRRASRAGLEAYDAVVPVIVRCARAAGLPKSKADAILRELSR